METLKQATIKDRILYLPDVKLSREEYLEIAKKLNFLGGKWKTNKKGFVFDREITLDEILGNEETKKDLQFFETPQKIAEYLVELAEIDENQTILEPSAGRGAIIKELHKKVPNNHIHYYEISDTNKKYLDQIEPTIYLGDDFLKEPREIKFSRIVANPPFSKNQDVDHIMKMYSMLSENGILVSVASPHWRMAKEKKCVEFRKFLDLVRAEVEEIKQGEFKESGTMIGANIVKITL